jgi:hypothetical protein
MNRRTPSTQLLEQSIKGFFISNPPHNKIMEKFTSKEIAQTLQKPIDAEMSLSRRSFLKVAGIGLVGLVVPHKIFNLGDSFFEREIFENDLGNAAKSYVSTTPQAAVTVSEVLRGKGAYPSNISGPLSIAIMLDWQLFPNGKISVGENARLTGTSPKDFWLANPEDSFSKPDLFHSTFPIKDFDSKRVTENIGNLDFENIPEVGKLIPGDLLFLTGGSFTHFVTISRKDEAGCIYATSNIATAKPGEFIISEIKLWDPRIKAGYFQNWANGVGSDGAKTGTNGFYIWRSKSSGNKLLNDPISKLFRDWLINRLREQEKGEWNVLIREVGKGELFEWRDAMVYHPASTIKVPIAIAVMQCIYELNAKEINEKGLEAVLQTKDWEGRTFGNLVNSMLVNSEEDATESCVNFINSLRPLDQFFFELEMIDTSYLPRRSTQRDLFKCWENLFLGNLLEKEATSYLIKLLEAYTKNDDTLLGRIRNAFPGTRQWNKRGSVLSADLSTLQDTGFLKIDNRFFYIGIAGRSIPNHQTTLEEMGAFFGELCTNFVSYIEDSRYNGKGKEIGKFYSA